MSSYLEGYPAVKNPTKAASPLSFADLNALSSLVLKQLSVLSVISSLLSLSLRDEEEPNKEECFLLLRKGNDFFVPTNAVEIPTKSFEREEQTIPQSETKIKYEKKTVFLFIILIVIKNNFINREK